MVMDKEMKIICLKNKIDFCEKNNKHKKILKKLKKELELLLV